MLDACFRRDGESYAHGDYESRNTYVPKEQLDALRAYLDASPDPAIVFVHQRLDGEGNLRVMNAAQVRRILEDSGRVLAVFQGHDHKGAKRPPTAFIITPAGDGRWRRTG